MGRGQKALQKRNKKQTRSKWCEFEEAHKQRGRDDRISDVAACEWMLFSFCVWKGKYSKIWLLNQKIEVAALLLRRNIGQIDLGKCKERHINTQFYAKAESVIFFWIYFRAHASRGKNNGRLLKYLIIMSRACVCDPAASDDIESQCPISLPNYNHRNALQRIKWSCF